MFIAVMWYEGKTRYEYGTAYFEQLGKGYMRHVAFGSLIALRYRISRKSKAFLAEQGCSDHTNIPEHLQEALREQHLFMPELWVSSALSNGRDPV